MAKQANVGSSWHTPTKHHLMWRFVEREVRAANRIDHFHRLVWLDLTAGDGIPAYEAPWHEACSPGILAHHATRTSKQPVAVYLYEKNADHYGKLLASLNTELPLLGYIPVDERTWRFERNGNRAWLRALNADGRTAPPCELRKNDAVLVLNDPNAITGWAMRHGFAREVDAQCKGLRILSTLGCNVSGGKRRPFKKAEALPFDEEPEGMSLEERSGWFDLIQRQQKDLPGRHDMLLAAFDKDPSQWAYLLTVPNNRDTWLREARIDAAQAFLAVGKTGQMAYFRHDGQNYEQIKDRLFLTKAELAERANTPLPFGDRTEDLPPPPEEDPVPYRTYAEYLKHPRFLLIRKQVFDRAAGHCERCGQRPPTEPHHLRYPPWGTFDVPENMIAVCHGCHCEIHGKAS